MKFYLAGQNNFGNRGCEALVRSTIGMISQHFPDSTFYCPSYEPDLDSRQWLKASESGLEFVAAPPFPFVIKWWARACRIFPIIETFGKPKFPTDPVSKRALSQCDALIMTGGDVISLDYGVPSLYEWAGFVENARAMGLKTILWAASVGPFSAKPAVEKEMVKHLATYDAITIRETESFKYLQGLGLTNVTLVADPAFNLQPEPFDAESLLFGNAKNVLGLNVSPLIRNFRESDESRIALDREIAAFVRQVVATGKYSVALIPHVDPLTGDSKNSDTDYMKGILEQLADIKDKVVLVPRTLNAAQLKYLISKLQFFIGARTHATIAAFSMGIPTISIAYSVKAKGINKDLFGDTRFVLETPKVDKSSLIKALELLESEEKSVHELLAQRVPEWRKRAFGSVDALKKVLTVK